MALGDPGSLQNEWAPGRMGAQNGDLELGQFEPRHFSTLYTHINQDYATKSISATTKLARDYIPTHTFTRASALYTIPVRSALYTIPVRTHGRTYE